MTMTLERALDVLRVVTSRAMQGSETRDAYDCVVSHLAQSARSVAAKDAEIERLSQESAQQFIRARDWAELSGKNEDRASLAESLLAAANALLRNIAGCQWFNREAPATVELIDVYLQGVGDEARKTNTR